MGRENYENFKGMEKLDHYKFVKQIGDGLTSEVYLAKD